MSRVIWNHRTALVSIKHKANDGYTSSITSATSKLSQDVGVAPPNHIIDIDLPLNINRSKSNMQEKLRISVSSSDVNIIKTKTVTLNSNNVINSKVHK